MLQGQGLIRSEAICVFGFQVKLETLQEILRGPLCHSLCVEKFPGPEGGVPVPEGDGIPLDRVVIGQEEVHQGLQVPIRGVVVLGLEVGTEVLFRQVTFRFGI